MKKINIAWALAATLLIPVMVHADSLKKTIQKGASGDDVKILQTILSADPSIYPEGTVTGYYGTLTTQAIQRLQKKYGLQQVGVVGPQTLKVINQLLSSTPLEVRNITVASSSSGSTTANLSVVCQSVPPGHLIAPGWIKKTGGVQTVPECQKLPPGISKQITGGTTTPPTPPAPDETAPIISSLTYSASTSTINVSWLTNEYASTRVYYDTASPVSLSTSTMQSTPGYWLTHSLTLKNLLASTTYYFLALSADGSGNTATTTQVTLATLPVTTPPDTTAPTFTWIFSYPFANVATVMWITNEPATGKLYYGTSTPLNASSTTVTLATSSMNQSATLSGLNASTTYYFMVEARDGAGNTATSSVQSFRTQ